MFISDAYMCLYVIVSCVMSVSLYRARSSVYMMIGCLYSGVISLYRDGTDWEGGGVL